MNMDFVNRIDAQREFLKVINSHKWACEPLCALSHGAIERWVNKNDLSKDNDLVRYVFEAGDALFFLANKSQEQVSPEYKDASIKISSLIARARHAIKNANDEKAG